MTVNKGLLGAGMVVALVTATSAMAQPAESPARRATNASKPVTRGKPVVVDLSAAVAALSGADVEAAARATETLGTNTTSAAHDALLDALAFGLPPAVAVPAMAALAAHPAPPDVAALRRYAGHHNPSVRGAALGALAMYPDPAARAVVIAGLRDPAGHVRTAAAAAAGSGRIREAVDSLLLLLARGEESAARALAQLANPDLARTIADHLGKVPDASLALCLGAILKRADFGPDPARVELVRAIAKIQHAAAIHALTDYIDSVPKQPPRPSRQEAEGIVGARTGGK